MSHRAQVVFQWLVPLFNRSSVLQMLTLVKPIANGYVTTIPKISNISKLKRNKELSVQTRIGCLGDHGKTKFGSLGLWGRFVMTHSN